MDDTTPQADPLQPAPVTVQLTAVFDVFVTVAVNCFCSPAGMVADVGEIDMATASVTVTSAVPDFVGSADEVAFTVTCGGTGTERGGAYRPVALMVPQDDPVQPLPDRVHATAVFVVCATVAVNCCLPARGTVAVDGVTVTEIGSPMVTDAVADLVGSATEVAVTKTAGGLGTLPGAV